jgi:hypothetical protein
MSQAAKSAPYPPATQAAAVYPPATQAAAVYPPATQAAATYPPATQAAAVYPPATQAAATYPPATYPPATQAAATYRPVPPRSGRPAWHWPALALGTLAALYFVGRGVAELFVIHWTDPASYAGDWGGPSLAGVFAVHSGPAVAIVAGSVIWLCRRLRARRHAV